MDLAQNIIEKFGDLTYSQKKIANYIMDRMDKVPLSSLADLSEQIGVSTTSIIRFARELGYDGYSDMQASIPGMSAGSGENSEKKDEGRTKEEITPLLRSAMETDISNIRQTMESISMEELSKAVDLICRADSVYVLGMRSSYAVAYYMGGRLGEIRENVRIIQSSGMMYPEEIIGAREGDVLLAYLFPRYSKVATNITSWIKSKGADVILVTGQHDSSIRKYGDVILPCVTRSVSFRNSYAAPLSISNYITQAVYEKLGAEGEKIRKQTEGLLDQGYYLPL